MKTVGQKEREREKKRLGPLAFKDFYLILSFFVSRPGKEGKRDAQEDEG